MFPKKGQVWTYRERGRFFSIMMMGLPSLGLVVIGIFLAIARGEWLLLVLGILALTAAATVFFENERKRRDEP